MRYLHDHETNPANSKIEIRVEDEPGDGGANHVYRICSEYFIRDVFLEFQNGPVDSAGPNGITQEVLIAVCIDRLRSFQAGVFLCRENAIALTKLEEALMWLHRRTQARVERGVEGTHTP